MCFIRFRFLTAVHLQNTNAKFHKVRQRHYLWGRKRLHFCTTNLLRTICTKFIHNLSGFVNCIKNILVFFRFTVYNRVVLPRVDPGNAHYVSWKFPPLNSITLSNLNRFSNFLHCWKAYEICYKTHTTHLTLSMLLHYLGKLKIQIFCRHGRKCKQIAFQVHRF